MLNARQVDYLIVGAYALSFYGVPRYTGDLDIFIRAEKQNAERITAALEDFGFKSLNLKVEDFIVPDNVIQLGFPPIRIDILTSLSGVTWDECFDNRITGVYADVKVNYIGKREFAKNKRATGRKKDLADLEAIGESS